MLMYVLGEWEHCSPVMTDQEEECQTLQPIICGSSVSHKDAIDEWETFGCQTERSVSTNLSPVLRSEKRDGRSLTRT
jgi:hypothetical protein